MKKYLYLLALSLLFISCGEKEIDRSKLQEKNGIFYEVNQQKPFTGKATYKYPDGELILEETYKDGQKDGPFKSYFENGQPEFEITYKDGKLNGPFKNYYNNGQPEFEMTYKDGQRDGLVKGYSENGKLKLEVLFKNGKITKRRDF